MTTSRYSDQELAVFKAHIESKLEVSRADLSFLLEQIEDLSDSMGNDADWLDDTSNNNDMEMLNTMVSRHRHHIRDLENALLRIENKNYGICVVSGNLIDKRRLMAVPTTTKSVIAKNALAENKETEKPSKSEQVGKKDYTKKTETKVISRKKLPTELNGTHPEEKDDLQFDIDALLNEVDQFDPEGKDDFDF